MILEYTKRPVTIEAARWDGTADEATPIMNWALDYDVCISYHCADECKSDVHTLRISTLEGTMHASPGDYIIKGVQGEFYPCKPDIFKATYVGAK